MSLSEFSIKNPVFAWMLMTAMIVFGAISFGRLGVSQMPDIDFPVLEVRTTWEGAAPEIMETELVDQIEQEVIAVEGLKEIRSTVRQGSATVELEFDLDRDIDAAVQEVQAALSQVRLPLNVDPPIVRKNTTEGEPIMWIALSGEADLRELITYVDTYLIDQLQVIEGVGEVQIGGFSERNLRIWVENEKLKQYELSVLDVQEAVRREHLELAGGYIENSQNELNVRTMGEGLTAKEVSNILITRRGGQIIYESNIRIGDIGTVEDGVSDIRRMSRVEGANAITIGVRKQRGSNEVEVGKTVKAQLERIREGLPDGMDINVVVDYTIFVEQVVKQTEHELLIAGILTAFLCLAFLGSFSSALNVVLSIPTSVIGTFTILYFLGFTLNTFTLLALALAIGIIVDDSIMVLENIVRHFQMGKNRIRASRDGATEITFAAIAATIAVVAIFLPVAFMEGIIGKFFFQFGVTITAAVMLSLLEALTLAPMRCSQFLNNTGRKGGYERKLEQLFHYMARSYGWTLRYALKFRWPVVLISLGLFIWSVVEIRGLRSEFVPSQDQNYMRIQMRAPSGTSLAATSEKVKIVEEYLQSQPEVDRFFVSIGGGGGTTRGFAGVTLTPKDEREKSQAQLISQFREDLAKRPELEGVRLTYQDVSTRGFTARRSHPVEFNLTGGDFEKLNQAANEIIRRMNETGLVLDLDSNYRTGMPELRIIPDRQAAALRGVSMEDVGRTINAAIGGIREGKFTNDGRRYDVRIRLKPEERLHPEDIKDLQVRTSFGELISLGDVITLEEISTVESISRVNRQRAISITGNLVPGASQSDALAAASQISREVLPDGYGFNLEGGAATFKESFDGLLFTFVLGIVVAYMVLASQFNSFLHPVSVLMALPFSITGAGIALGMSGQSLNLYSAIGGILLMGIAKKNSILLVEFTNHQREKEGLGILDALKTACPIRLRPILMTSCATMGAALPSAISTGPGSETRIPMAITIIGGVLVSTCFTLYVVPCVYLILGKFERKQVTEEELEALREAPDSTELKHPSARKLKKKNKEPQIQKLSEEIL